MVVDDELDSLAVITRMLERCDHVVHAFGDPRTALDHMKDCTQCSIVISDIKMPGMTGLELVKYLKRIRPALCIMLMTAFPIKKEEWRKVLPSSEVDGFIRKPFSMSQLIDAIQECEKQPAR